MSDVIKTPIKEPVILDRTGREIAKNLKSIAAKLWGEKVVEIPSKDVNFYDYDGTRVYSYYKAEFLGLDALPANPAHEGLTAQGWNWTLAQAKEYVAKYGILDIGQTYTTDDGKTRLYVEMDYTQNCTANIKINQSVEDGVTVDWGDGSEAETVATAGDVAFSHTYAAEGNYVITLTPAEGATIRLGQNTTVANKLTGAAPKCFFYQGPAGMLSGKDALVAIEIGEGVTDIGTGAFCYMTRLKYITIPNTVTSIRDIVFYACIALKAIVYPSSVTKIGNLQHGFNYEIKALCLPPTITAIGEAAFRVNNELGRLCIPEGVTTLNQYVCYGLHTAKEIVLPDTITGAIPNYGFGHCYGLVKINIPSGVTSIGIEAFTNCHNLRECVLPEGVTTIGKTAFSSCFGFHDFIIPSTVTKIDGLAFLYADGTAIWRVKPTTPPALEPTAFSNVRTNDIIVYVPYSEDHSILEAYKSATGWASKADYIVEEDAPVAEGGEG